MRYEMKVSDVFAFAEAVGIQTRERGNEIKFKFCPRCRGEHDTWTFSVNAITGAFCCPRASCGYHGHFVELARDYDFPLTGIAQSKYKELPQMRLLTSTPAENYLFSRGIRKEITRAYSVTTSPADDNLLIFPFYSSARDADGKEYKRMEFVKYRRTDFDKSKHKSKEWCESECKPILFGMDKCNPAESKTLVITEGQIDSLSLASAGIQNAVSVPNGARGFTWAENCRSFVEQFDTIVAFGDCERGEITLVRELKDLFPKIKIRVPRLKDYLGEKDANDILRNFGEQALQTAVKNADSFKPSTIKDMADVEQVDLSQIPHIQTFFPALDKATTGLYEGQLVTLTGKRGTGKSTFASMLAAAALYQNWNVLFYSGEMADYEVKRWMDYQLAGDKAIQRRVSLQTTDTTYLPDEFRQQLSEWYRNRLFIVDNDAMDEDDNRPDLCEQIIAAVKAYGIKVVIVDNLMTAIDAGEDIYIQQSRFARKLKKVAKKYHIIIILVAHPRKTKTKELDCDEISGSGDVTNLSDIVIALDRVRTEKADGEKVTKTLLALQKNRATGVLMQDSDRVQLKYSMLSKRLYQVGDNGICHFPFDIASERKEQTKLPF